MWVGKSKALTVDISDNVGDKIINILLDTLPVDIDVDIDDKDVRLQINVNPDGSWGIAGINGYPVDYGKRLVNV